MKDDMSANARNVYKPIKLANARDSGPEPTAAAPEAEVGLHLCTPTTVAKTLGVTMSATTFNKSGQTTTLNLNLRDSLFARSLLVRMRSRHSSFLVHSQPLKNPYQRHH